MEIIEYQEKYKSQVIDLILDIYEKELGFTGYERPDIHAIEETYQKDGKSNFWVALKNNQVIATVGLLGKTNELAYIKRMVIKKEFRKLGLGKKLLKTAIDFAKQKEYKKVYAGTVKENPNAIAFYKHLGFTETTDVPDDITAAGDSICLEVEI